MGSAIGTRLNLKFSGDAVRLVCGFLFINICLLEQSIVYCSLIKDVFTKDQNSQRPYSRELHTDSSKDL